MTSKTAFAKRVRRAFSAWIGKRPPPRRAAPAEALAQAEALFTVVLQRAPEPGLDMTERALWPWRRQLAVLLLSAEFEERILAPLRAGGADAAGAPDPALLGAATTLPSAGETPHDPADRAAADALAAGSADWRSFQLALLAADGPCGAAMAEDAARRPHAEFERADLTERAAIARMAAAAPPSGGIALSAALIGGAQIAGTLRVFGATPRPIGVRARRSQGGSVSGGAGGAVIGSAVLTAESAAPAPFTIDCAMMPTEIGEALLIELFDPAAGAEAASTAPPSSPPRRLIPRPDPASLTDRLRAIDRAHRDGRRAEAERRIADLRQSAPFAIEPLRAAVEGAFWRGDPAGAAGLLRDAAARDPGLFKDAAFNRLRLRAAAATGDRPSAKQAFAALPAPTPEDQALARIAADQDAAGAGRWTGRPDKIVAAAAAIGAGPKRIGDWLETLDLAEASRAIAALGAYGPGQPAALSFIAPRPFAGVTARTALAAARIAEADDRSDAAALWLERALALTSDRADLDAGVELAVSIDHPLAWRIAAVALAALQDAGRAGAEPQDAGCAGGDSPQMLERLALFERRLLRHDPTHPRTRLDAACAALSRIAGRKLLEDPLDRGARRQLAAARLYGGDVATAHDVFAALLEDTPEDLSLRQSLLDAKEALQDHAGAEAAAAAAAGRQMLIRQARALCSQDRGAEAMALLGAALEETADGGDAPLQMTDALAGAAFFQGDFDKAARAAAAVTAARPGRRRTRLLAAAAALEQDAPERAEAELAAIAGPLGAQSDRRWLNPQEIDRQLMAAAAAERQGRGADCVAALNMLYRAMGCRPVTVRPGARFGPDTLIADDSAAHNVAGALLPSRSAIGPAPLTDGPLVTVIMTTYNAAPHLDTALRSVLDQSYGRLELIVVDDASEDDTPQRLLQAEATDPRIRAILKTRNDGTYVSKNLGLLQARGDFVTFHDSDDWSHPDRIGKSVAAMTAQPSLIAVQLDWIRMTAEGRAQIRASGEIAQIARISMMMRRAPALARAGFFDSVRIEADTEYARRLALLFGADAVAHLRWPLMIGRAHARSLTSDAGYGVTRTGMTPARRSYQAASRVWHADLKRKLDLGGPGAEEVGRMPYPLVARPFDIPPMVAP